MAENVIHEGEECMESLSRQRRKQTDGGERENISFNCSSFFQSGYIVLRAI